MSFLELKGVSRRYGAVTALDGVDLSIAEGTRTAIVGPSGCGKTTLMRLIAGFEAPDAGTICLDGQLLTDSRASVPAHQRGIGLVMQDGALFPHLSIADNIGFGLPRTDRDRARRIADLVRLVGLDPAITTRRPHQLSGGQQQRVALARALATRPRVILLDEPFSALDSGLRSATRRAVSALLADAGITAILVTHDQQEALSFADQLAVMSDGRFLQVGPPQDLYSRPASAIVATFLGEALILPARIADGIAHTELGAFAADDPTPRDKASIVVRPEQVIIEPAPEQGGQGALRAVVREIEFVGAATTLLLELENSAHARRAETAPFALTCVGVNRLAAGEWVRLRVDTPVHVLP